MTRKELKYVLSLIDNEGFDYGLRHYTGFAEIKDEEFHRLLKNYVDAAEEIEDYIRYGD